MCDFGAGSVWLLFGPRDRNRRRQIEDRRNGRGLRFSVGEPSRVVNSKGNKVPLTNEQTRLNDKCMSPQ